MSIRSVVGAALRDTVGRPRTERLRRREVSIRTGLARRVAPQSAWPAAPVTGTGQSSAEAVPSRQETIEAIRRAGREGLGSGSQPPAGLKWVSPDPYEHHSSGMHKHHLLAAIHDLLQPRTYFEIGIDKGQSLTLSSTRTIAVDPAYRITHPIRCDVRTFTQTSDDFFRASDGFDHFAGQPIDLAFIDGMHLAEFAMRDFMNTEKHMSPGGVIILDDMLPRNALEAQRIRCTTAWAGDVFKIHEVLCRYRPDLTILPVNTEPTGSYLVVGLDPASTVLDAVYEDALPELRATDPQTVDPAWLRRADAYEPDVILSSPAWAALRELRDRDAGAEDYASVWAQLRGQRDRG